MAGRSAIPLYNKLFICMSMSYTYRWIRLLTRQSSFIDCRLPVVSNKLPFTDFRLTPRSNPAYWLWQTIGSLLLSYVRESDNRGPTNRMFVLWHVVYFKLTCRGEKYMQYHTIYPTHNNNGWILKNKSPYLGWWPSVGGCKLPPILPQTTTSSLLPQVPPLTPPLRPLKWHTFITTSIRHNSMLDRLLIRNTVNSVSSETQKSLIKKINLLQKFEMGSLSAKLHVLTTVPHH